MATTEPDRRSKRRSATQRWLVHLALILTAVVSLAVEPILTLHIAFGLAFVGVVVVHLLQRRRVSVRLLVRLTDLKRIHRPGGRLAVADSVLLLVTAGMLASGIWDWATGHATRIRWHAITGVVLAVYLVIHTLRRAGRLRRSQIR